jgi:hypothetical protein
MKEQAVERDSNYWSTQKIQELLRKGEEEGLDYKSVENPFHEGETDLKRANLLYEYTPEEIVEIQKCAQDSVYFSKYCQVMTDDGLRNIVLRDYQESILREYQAHRFSILLAPRQVGKCLLPNSKITTRDQKNLKISKIIKKKEVKFIQLLKNFVYFFYDKL